jgi:predicted phosphodiesterase
MKLQVLSDLHLSQGGLAHPKTDADIVILAGDIARPEEAVAWAAVFDKPVLYVAGNHEFYGGSIEGTVPKLKDFCWGTKVRVLDDEAVVIDGVRFLGSTLWTDMRLFGEGAASVAAADAAKRFMRDYSRIHIDEAGQRPFTPGHAQALFDRHSAWLAQQLEQHHDGPTVVITHHAPSPLSIHPRFAGSPINACFVSNAEHLLGRERVQLWIHGHTHDSFDYVCNGTRVICNPRGYARNDVNENAAFNPGFVVEAG